MSELDNQLASIREELLTSPEDVPLRLHLAGLLRKADLPQQAIQEYQSVLRRDPNSVDAQFALGELFFATNELEIALGHLRNAIRLTPYDAPTMLLLAQVEAGLGQMDESLIHQGVARHLDPTLTNQPQAVTAPSNSAEDDFDPPAVSQSVPIGKSAATPANAGEPAGAITFAGVGGLEAVKEQIRLKILYPFQHPELYKAYGKKAGGGILLYGPPGCGKTLLARATAGEVRANFIHIGITDILDMYHGETERKLHKIFETARRKAPAVLFFDEVDAIGGKRLNMQESFLRAQVDQFLAEMDGMAGNNDNLLIIGATNVPWNVDSALMRPGRFDRVIFVPPPDVEAREAILKIHLHGKPAGPLDYPKLALRTEGCSGADLMGIVATAVDTALQESMQTGKIRPLTTEALLQARRETHLSMDDWLATARDYALYANQAGLYDEVLAYLKKRARPRRLG
jgi:transitional endoplasmic reticulum ATPase